MFPLFRRSLRRRRHGNSSGHHREPSIRRSLYPICLNHETGWDSHSDIFPTSIPSTRPALFRGCRRSLGPAGSPTHSPNALTSYKKQCSGPPSGGGSGLRRPFAGDASAMIQFSQRQRRRSLARQPDGSPLSRPNETPKPRRMSRKPRPAAAKEDPEPPKKIPLTAAVSHQLPGGCPKED